MACASVTEEAFAKINLTLDVLWKRADSFHEVKMVMQSVDLFDTVDIVPADANLSLTVEGADLPCDEGNIAYRAALLVAETAKKPPAIAIKITKRIPVAAGLAGGSTDAAAVLRGLNRLWELNWDIAFLEKLAAQLGSDVPFCLRGGTALAVGRGEIVQALPDSPEVHLVLACPNLAVSTAWVYANYADSLPKKRPDTENAVKALKLGDINTLALNLCNVLEAVTLQKYPVVEEIKRVMQDAGAIASLMSGSGPSVFAFAQDETSAKKIAEAVRNKTAAGVWTTKTRRALKII